MNLVDVSCFWDLKIGCNDFFNVFNIGIFGRREGLLLICKIYDYFENVVKIFFFDIVWKRFVNKKYRRL